MLLFLSSCDDGDIIVTSFDFEEERFEMCGEGRSKFLYHINNGDVFETLTLQLNSPNFALKDEDLVSSLEDIRIPLTGTNLITYRTYDAQLPTGRNAYFCATNPPSTPRVLQEYISVGGTVIIRTVVVGNNYESLIEVENLQLQDQGPDGGNISFTNKVLGDYVRPIPDAEGEEEEEEESGG